MGIKKTPIKKARKSGIAVRLTKQRGIYEITILIIFIICLSACGYNFAGRGGSLPSDINAIAIPFFTNKTFEPKIEDLFTDALINEFLKRGRVKIANREDTDAVITGIVRSFTTSSISFDENDTVIEYRATVTIEVSLKRESDGTIIWQSSGLSGNQEYEVSSTSTITDTNKREATRKIAEDLAEDIHNMIFEDF